MTDTKALIVRLRHRAELGISALNAPTLLNEAADALDGMDAQAPVDVDLGRLDNAIYERLCAADNQDVPLEEYPRIIREVIRATVKDYMDAEAWAELHRLRVEIKGPDGFATWKDAAVHERMLRMKGHPPAAQVPEGWKLVPVVATDEMLIAGWPIGDDWGRQVYLQEAERKYDAVLAAIPTPPAEKENNHD